MFALCLSLLSLAGLVALALGMEKHWRQLSQSELKAIHRRVLRIVGAILLVASLAVGVAGWGASIGVVVWFGWLSIVGLALVFSLPKFSRDRAERLEREARPLPVSFAIPGQRPHLVQWIAAAALVLILLSFAWRLSTATASMALTTAASAALLDHPRIREVSHAGCYTQSCNLPATIL